jgi:hypothetical protein
MAQWMDPSTDLANRRQANACIQWWMLKSQEYGSDCVRSIVIELLDDYHKDYQKTGPIYIQLR